MKKNASKISVLLFAVALFFSSCMSHTHVVGAGGTGGDSEKAKQWYLLFGIVPLNHINTSEMAKGAADYTITTESTVGDAIINAFTGFVTITSRTVKVTK